VIEDHLLCLGIIDDKIIDHHPQAFMCLALSIKEYSTRRELEILDVELTIIYFWLDSSN
jgi:hypothetical protein